MINPKQKAEALYLTTEKSQKEIAEQLGIDPKTLYRWIKQGHWRELKSTTRRMPSVLVENIYEQLDDINYNISQRERGSRHPGKDESLTINRLINCIEKVKKQTSQGQNIEFMMNFIDWVLPQNKDLADLLTNYGSAFLKGNEVHGFHPYDIEYQNEIPAEASAKEGDIEYPNPELEEEDDEEIKNRHPELVSGQRHPEFISGPHANTDKLAPEISPLERGQGCVMLSSVPWPRDPNSLSQTKPRHPELVSGPYNNMDLLAPDKTQPWPTDPNIDHHGICPLPLPAAATIGQPGEVGQESGIPTQLEINFQPTENQQTTTEINEGSMPGMPENNFPENRALEIPPLKGDVPQTTNVVSEQGAVEPGNEPQPPTTNKHTTDCPLPLLPATNFPPPPRSTSQTPTHSTTSL